MRYVVLLAVVTACNFSARLAPPGDDAAPADASFDAPPTSADVRFVAVTSSQTQLRAGLYAFDVVATLRNDLDRPIAGIAATLTFAHGTADRSAEFRWRDADARDGVMVRQPRTLEPGAEAMFRFRVDALPWAAPPGPIAINAAATFLDGTTPLSAAPATTPLELDFVAIGAPIVVNSTVDEVDADTEVCLREALLRAASQSGFDRIVFDPTVFPPSAPAVTLLSDGLGEITVGQNVVIDGRGAGVIVAVDTSWQNDGRYALKVTSGNVVVANLTFRNFGHGYPLENVSSNNCGSGNMGDGGAIRVDSGTLVLEGNRFEDPDVGERNCYAASLRLEGGNGHRILNNTWTEQVMDAIYVDTATREISGNVMNAGATTDDVDECIFIATQGGQPLWITGNICVDMEYSAVVANGTDAGALFVVHNTFVRNGRVSSSAVRRGGNRAITLRNNVYIGNAPSAIALDSNGNGFSVGYEATSGNALFSGSSSNVMNAGSNLDMADLGLANASGATRADFTPVTGSPLVGSGVDMIDVNGSAPDHFNGSGPERGAVELP